MLHSSFSKSASSKPASVSRYILSHTSRIYFRSWEMLMIQPLKPFKIPRITGPERGEKFRVGSSKINTLLPFMLIPKNNSFAFCPPESSVTLCSISSAVYFMLPRYVRIRVSSSFSHVFAKNSTGVSVFLLPFCKQLVVILRHIIDC